MSDVLHIDLTGKNTMDRVKEITDKLETLTASDYWPMPVYSDLLFSV